MSSDDDIDYSEIQSALGSIGLSAALIFGATLLSQGLGFLTRITMARYLPVEEYGNVTIGIAVLNLFGIAALVGMPTALSRYLPRQETPEERRRTIATGFQIVVLFSLALTTGIYLLAEPIALFVFGDVDLIWIIRIFAGVMPFYAGLKLSLGGFRGYEMTTPQVITQNVLRPGLQLAGIILFVSLGFGTAGIAFAYAMAFVFVGIGAIGGLFWISNLSITNLLSANPKNQYRRLLQFSLPLAASGAIMIIAKHSDLIILGIFKSSDIVGIYEVSYRMSMFVVMSITPAVGFLYQPIISRLHAGDEYQMMQKLYTATTRWVVVGTFPIFALFFLFSEQSLIFFFGNAYREAAISLSILTGGFMISQMVGLGGNFLTAVGETKTLMYISAATMVINIVGNIALIPIYGLFGAAVATASAQILNNTIQLYMVNRKFSIHPFTRKYVIPTSIMFLIFISVTVMPIPIRSFSIFEGAGFVMILTGIYLIVLLLTKSVLLVELQLLDALFDKIGLPFSPSKYLKQFI